MSLLENLLTPGVTAKLGWMLVHFVWQAAVVAMLLAAFLRLLRKSTAVVRYAGACSALVLIVMLPVATMQLIEVTGPVAEAGPAPMIPSPDATLGEAPIQIVDRLPPLSGPTEPLETADLTVPISWHEQVASALEPALPYLVLGWLLGVFGLSAWHLGGWMQLQRLKRCMVHTVGPALQQRLSQLGERLGVRRAVALLESALVEVPTVVGWLRPVILLPASALTGLPPEELEAVLAHELAHIRRYDYLVNILQTLVEILGFYHPAVWWVSHRIRVERENCCDDLAVRVCGDSVRYARALTSLEEARHSRAELAVAATGGSLIDRIARLLGRPAPDDRRFAWLPALIALLLVAVLVVPAAVALSMLNPQEANGQAKPASSIHVTTGISDAPPIPIGLTSGGQVKLDLILVDAFSDKALDSGMASQVSNMLYNKRPFPDEPRVRPNPETLCRPLPEIFAGKAYEEASYEIEDLGKLMRLLESGDYISVCRPPALVARSGQSISIAISDNPQSGNPNDMAGEEKPWLRLIAAVGIFARLDTILLHIRPDESPAPPPEPTKIGFDELAVDHWRLWHLASPANHTDKNGRRRQLLLFVRPTEVNPYPPMFPPAEGLPPDWITRTGTERVPAVVDRRPSAAVERVSRGEAAGTPSDGSIISLTTTILEIRADQTLDQKTAEEVFNRHLLRRIQSGADAASDAGEEPTISDFRAPLRDVFAKYEPTAATWDALWTLLVPRGYAQRLFSSGLGSSTVSGVPVKVAIGDVQDVNAPDSRAAEKFYGFTSLILTITPKMLPEEGLVLDTDLSLTIPGRQDATRSRSQSTIHNGRLAVLRTSGIELKDAEGRAHLLLVFTKPDVFSPPRPAGGRPSAVSISGTDANDGNVGVRPEQSPDEARAAQVLLKYELVEVSADRTLDPQTAGAARQLLVRRPPGNDRRVPSSSLTPPSDEDLRKPLRDVLFGFMPAGNKDKELVDLLVSSGYASLLSRPQLLVRENQSASIVIGPASDQNEPPALRLDVTAHVPRDSNAVLVETSLALSFRTDDPADPNGRMTSREVRTTTAIASGEYASTLVEGPVQLDDDPDKRLHILLIQPTIAQESPASHAPEPNTRKVNVSTGASGEPNAQSEKPQVLIDVTIAEVNDVARLDFETAIQIENILGKPTRARGWRVGPNNQLDLTIGEVLQQHLVNQPLPEETTRPLVDLLSSKGYIRVLAKPQILTRDGEEARIAVVANEYAQIVDNAAGPPRTEMVEAGTKVNLTPHVVGQDTVTLEIEAEITDLLPGSGEPVRAGAPFVRRRAKHAKFTAPSGSCLVLGMAPDPNNPQVPDDGKTLYVMTCPRIIPPPQTSQGGARYRQSARLSDTLPTRDEPTDRQAIPMTPAQPHVQQARLEVRTVVGRKGDPGGGVANPRVLVQAGREARIVAFGPERFPLNIPGTEEAAAPATRQQSGVVLSLTPQKIDGETVTFDIVAEIAYLVKPPQGGGPPILNRRTATGSCTVPYGGTVAAIGLTDNPAGQEGEPAREIAVFVTAHPAPDVNVPGEPNTPTSGAAVPRPTAARPRQMHLDVRTARMDRSALLNLGIQWSQPTIQNGDPAWPWGLEMSVGSSDRDSTESLLAALELLQRNNQAIISSQQVLAQDGRQSQIRNLREEWFGSIPEKIETGTVVSVTPHIGDTGDITLDVAVEVSSPAPPGRRGQGTDVPVVTRQTTRNTVTIRDGGTVALAGLTENLVGQEGESLKEVAVFVTAYAASHPDVHGELSTPTGRAANGRRGGRGFMSRGGRTQDADGVASGVQDGNDQILSSFIIAKVWPGRKLDAGTLASLKQITKGPWDDKESPSVADVLALAPDAIPADQFSAIVRLLNSAGYLEILANPRIMTNPGEPAQIDMGGDPNTAKPGESVLGLKLGMTARQVADRQIQTDVDIDLQLTKFLPPPPGATVDPKAPITSVQSSKATTRLTVPQDRYAILSFAGLTQGPPDDPDNEAFWLMLTAKLVNPSDMARPPRDSPADDTARAADTTSLAQRDASATIRAMSEERARLEVELVKARQTMKEDNPEIARMKSLIEALSQRIGETRERLQREPLTLAREQYVANDPRIRALAEEIGKVEVDLIKARQTRSESHPDIVRAKASLAGLQDRSVAIRAELNREFDQSSIHPATGESFGAKVERVLKLSQAARTSDWARLPDLFEERPVGSKSYEMRPGVVVMRQPRESLSSDLHSHCFYYLPDKDIFYVQHDSVWSSTQTFYGPFQGNPSEVLNAPEIRRWRDGPWGEAVEGVQLRLWADRTIWRADRIPALHWDVRNTGTRQYLHVPEGQRFAQLEVDGVWHQWPVSLHMARLAELGVGQTLDDQLVTVSPIWSRARPEDLQWRGWDGWVVPDDVQPSLQLTPGRHSIRVALIIQPSRVNTGGGFRVVSQPVEITITPPGPGETGSWPPSPQLTQAVKDAIFSAMIALQGSGRPDQQEAKERIAETQTKAAQAAALAENTPLHESVSRMAATFAQLQQAVDRNPAETADQFAAASKAYAAVVEVFSGERPPDADPASK